MEFVDRQRRTDIDIQTKNADVPDDVAEIVQRCLSQDPDARPTAAELAATLRAILAPTKVFLSRRLVITGLATAATVACGVAYFRWPAADPSNVPDKPDALTALAQAAIKAGEYSKAIAILDRIETKSPRIIAGIGYCKAEGSKNSMERVFPLFFAETR
ncbi:MAG: tetratricopeptide repeat protein [Planctomycetes bacterium]|nr:tetratricopeptide repeat protein [Planctomycetota bacterium]